MDNIILHLDSQATTGYPNCARHNSSREQRPRTQITVRRRPATPRGMDGPGQWSAAFSLLEAPTPQQRSEGLDRLAGLLQVYPACSCHMRRAHATAFTSS